MRIFKKTAKFLLIFSFILIWIFSGWPRIWQNPPIPPEILRLNSADGGGSNTVSPVYVAQSSTGNTFTFTYTADVLKDSGETTISVPAGWSEPQGISGTAGYTTVSSVAGTIGNVKNVLDATTNWTAPSHMALSADTSDKQEGSASLKNDITSYAAANEQWYYNYGAATNWGTANSTNGSRIGMWIKSSVNTASGDLSWQDDDTASLASPVNTLAIAALTANTWTYTSVTLGTAESAARSYGYRYTTDLGVAQTVRADSIAVLFDAADVTTNWQADANITVGAVGSGQEGTNSIRCTYAAAAGTGTSGECFRTATAGMVIGPGTTVSFWVRSSVALNAGDFAWLDDGSASVGSPEDTVSLPAISANVWTYVTLTADYSANKNCKSYGFRQVVDKGALTLDIDAMGKQIDAGDSTTGWTVPTAGTQTLSAETTIKKEGTGSLKNAITANATAGDKWYETFGSAQDWSSYTTVGFWIRSSVVTTDGQLQVEYDDAADLSSPIASLNIGALAVDTWSWQKLTLTGTRTSISSYGIKYTADIGAASIYLDFVLLGPGSPTFSGSGPWTIRMVFLSLTTDQTVTITYGSGGGSSGVTAPATAGVNTFTTQDRDTSDGILTNLTAGSPTITVNAKPVLGTISDIPDPVNVGSNVTFSSGIWTDDNAGETLKMFVCKTNELVSQSTGGCTSGNTWYASGSYTATNPQTGDYQAQAGDVATSPNSYYVFICDAKQVSNSCSDSSSGTFIVQAVAEVSVSVSPDNFSYGIVPAGTASSTLGLWGGAGITATNGAAIAHFYIYGADTTGSGTGWTLAENTTGNNYMHEFCEDTTNDCTLPTGEANYYNLTASPQELKLSVGPGGTVAFQLRITTPQAPTDVSVQSAVVTVQASAP